VFSNYLLLFLLTIIFLEIFFILIQTVKNKFSCHVLSENAILIAPNFASYCGVRSPLLMNLGGSSKVVMDDCRKSQTLDSLPAKGGGLPIVIIY
jgi:hypothetical protein